MTKNLNKFRLSANALLLPSGVLGNLPAFDRIANDLGKPMDINAIQICAMMSGAAVLGSTNKYRFALGLTDIYNSDTNIFEWMLMNEHATTTLNSGAITNVINHTIGDFKNPVFTLEPFETDLRNSNANKGEIHFVAQRATASQNQYLDAVIYLYYDIG